jgi:hypothetical protein
VEYLGDDDVYLTESALLKSIFRQIATPDGSGNLQEHQLILMLLSLFADQYRPRSHTISLSCVAAAQADLNV